MTDEESYAWESRLEGHSAYRPIAIQMACKLGDYPVEKIDEWKTMIEEGKMIALNLPLSWQAWAIEFARDLALTRA